MRFVLFINCLLLSFSLLASISFHNDREGESFYYSKAYRSAQKRALKLLPSEQILSSFKNVLAEVYEKCICSFKINTEFLNKLKDYNPSFDEFKGALYHLREMNELDDTSLKILLNAFKVQKTEIKL